MAGVKGRAAPIFGGLIEGCFTTIIAVLGFSAMLLKCSALRIDIYSATNFCTIFSVSVRSIFGIAQHIKAQPR